MPSLPDLHPLPSSDVLAYVVDVHCHTTDSPLDEEFFSKLSHRICAMATRGTDQELVADLARRYPDKVVPCFGAPILTNILVGPLTHPTRISPMVYSLDLLMRLTFQRNALPRTFSSRIRAQT